MEEVKDFGFRGALQKYLDQRHNALPVLTLKNFRQRLGLAGAIESGDPFQLPMFGISSFAREEEAGS